MEGKREAGKLARREPATLLNHKANTQKCLGH